MNVQFSPFWRFVIVKWDSGVKLVDSVRRYIVVSFPVFGFFVNLRASSFSSSSLPSLNFRVLVVGKLDLISPLGKTVINTFMFSIVLSVLEIAKAYFCLAGGDFKNGRSLKTNFLVSSLSIRLPPLSSFCLGAWFCSTIPAWALVLFFGLVDLLTAGTFDFT